MAHVRCPASCTPSAIEAAVLRVLPCTFLLPAATLLTTHCVLEGVTASTKQTGADALVQPLSGEEPVLSSMHLTHFWYVGLAALVVSQVSLPEAVLPEQCED